MCSHWLNGHVLHGDIMSRACRIVVQRLQIRVSSLCYVCMNGMKSIDLLSPLVYPLFVSLTPSSPMCMRICHVSNVGSSRNDTALTTSAYASVWIVARHGASARCSECFQVLRLTLSRLLLANR